MLTKSQVIRELKKRQGRRSDTEFAAEIGISSAYWSMIRSGLREPGPKLIKKLGMKKVYVKQ